MDKLLFAASASITTVLFRSSAHFCIPTELVTACEPSEAGTIVPLSGLATHGDLAKIQARVRQLQTTTSESTENCCGTAIANFLNQQDEAGNAGIHGAVFSGHIDIVVYLYQNGASFTLQNGLGCTAVWLASGYNHISILEYIMEKVDDQKAAILTTDYAGNSPLLAAASKGNVDICKKLLNVGKVNGCFEEMTCATNKNRDSVLSVAIAAGIDDLELLSDFCHSTCIVNLANSNGLTPLLIACERNSVDVVDLLLHAGAFVKVSDNVEGNSPLGVAAFCGNEKVIDLLVANEPWLVNVASSETGCTPLWLAVRAGHTSCVERLLKAGADPSQANKEGLSPRQAATKYKRKDCIALLDVF